MVALIYTPELLNYDFGTSHPLKPKRLARTYQLIEAYGLLSNPQAKLIKPDAPAKEQDLLRIHSPEYISAVKQVSCGNYKNINPYRYGLGTSDNPIFENMYEAACWYTAGSILAAELIQSNIEAFNFSGGLHHAHRELAHGFCIFNDPAIAIHILKEHNYKVAYIDIDAHHGDGVQAAFYNSSQVLTISLHESGRFLFPGTGEVYELGEGEGRGYSVNLPLSPYTDDEVYIFAFEELVPALINSFNPDIVVAQLGVDAHFQDPLTHLCLTLKGYHNILKLIRELGKPIVALGGGGYNVDIVPRAWCIIYAGLLGVELPDNLPEAYKLKYDVDYLWDTEAPEVSKELKDMAWKTVKTNLQWLKEALNLF